MNKRELLLLSILGVILSIRMLIDGDDVLFITGVFLLFPSVFFMVINSNESFLNVGGE